jgi:hypothetical protein
MFAPQYSITRQVPGWLSTTPPLLVQDLYDYMASQPKLSLRNRAGTTLDVAALLKDARYDYAALTSSRPSLSDGDFAFATAIDFDATTVKGNFKQEQFLDVTVTSHIFTGSQLDSLGDVTHTVRVKLGEKSISQMLSTLATPKRAEIRSALSTTMDTHARALAETMLCLPLTAVMAKADDGLHVSVGARQGLSPNHLAVVSGKMTPWTILRVTKADASGATLLPLNRQRKLADLHGQHVTFLEFN